jgi:hypothetical protein
LYTLGGVAYATHRPDPKPGSFGYHEVFHLLTVIAATCQYVAVLLAISHRSLMSPGPTSRRSAKESVACVDPDARRPHETGSRVGGAGNYMYDTDEWGTHPVII